MPKEIDEMEKKLILELSIKEHNFKVANYLTSETF
jgi:hypothetical protein